MYRARIQELFLSGDSKYNMKASGFESNLVDSVCNEIMDIKSKLFESINNYSELSMDEFVSSIDSDLNVMDIVIHTMHRHIHYKPNRTWKEFTGMFKAKGEDNG